MCEELNLVARCLGIDPNTLPPLETADSGRCDRDLPVSRAIPDSDLSDLEFELLSACFPPEPASENAIPNSVVLNALLWSRRASRKFTQLPARYGGSPEAVRKRCERWAVAGVWDRVLGALESVQLGEWRRAELRALCVLQIRRGERIRRSRCAGLVKEYRPKMR